MVQPKPVEGPTFFTDANKKGLAGFTGDADTKVIQTPYTSVQKAELYAIILFLSTMQRQWI